MKATFPKILTGIILGVFLNQFSQAAEQPFQKKALAILKKSIAYKTSIGFGLVPKLAQYYKREFIEAGFSEKDIHIIAVGKTAALIVRFRGDGSSGKKPILLSTHMDVVTADPKDWERDPFQLIKSQGFYFGRGVSDDKFGVAMISATLMRLKHEGYIPNRDLILVVSGDEETSMKSIQKVTTQYKSLIDAEFAIIADGGGGVLNEEGKAVTFMVNVAEKTYATFEVTATNPGGHSSLPRKDNAILDLNNALLKIFDYHFPVQNNELTRSYFRKTAPLIPGELGDAMRKIVVNPADKKAIQILRSHPEFGGVLNTTCVPTMLKGGHAENALPQSATATINCRIFPGSGIKNTLNTLKKIVANEHLQWKTLDEPVPSKISPIRADIMNAIKKGVALSYPNIPIIPSMALGGSDGIYIRAAGIPSYVFSGIFMKASDEFAHGKNERVPVATIPVALKLWYSVLKTLTTQK